MKIGQSTKRIIAREFLWLVSVIGITVVLWLLVMYSQKELGYSEYDQSNELARVLEGSLFVLWIGAFPMRYIILTTKWSIRTVKSGAESAD